MQDRHVRGATLRSLRLQAGLRVRDLAAAVGITANYLTKIERTNFQPSDVVAYRAARVLTEHLDTAITVEDFSDAVEPVAS